ncbi:conjugal transfer protein, partial [Betaproteobacteria bacterium PRO4]|nr:conjugal transfer protein [Betaproteobacteria bacterium PRO4]
MKNSVLRRGSYTPTFIQSARSAVTTSEGKELLEAAQKFELEQQVALEAAPIEQTYQEALAVYVQSKYSQVEQIEDRLENLIDRQQARLQQAQAGKPGFLARPGTRQTWQSEKAKQQARLQVLHTRLEIVRDIKEGMGIHGAKIEEL